MFGFLKTIKRRNNNAEATITIYFSQDSVDVIIPENQVIIIQTPNRIAIFSISTIIVDVKPAFIQRPFFVAFRIISVNLSERAVPFKSAGQEPSH